jgi:hypothetical protein
MAGNDRRKSEFALLMALASGYSMCAAARASGLSERTVRRRMEDSTFQEQVTALRTDLLRRAVGRLSRAGYLAVKTLEHLAKYGKSETVRMGAARGLLEHMFRGNDAILIDQRLTALEKSK